MGPLPGRYEDAHMIVPGLWMGSRPPPGHYRPVFDVIVLAAKEYQPDDARFPGVRLIHAPIVDGTPSSDELRIVSWAAGEAARHHAKGRKVLVTCAAGLNRSGFIVALMLRRLHNLSPSSAIDRIRRKRHPDALFNPDFVKYVMLT